MMISLSLDEFTLQLRLLLPCKHFELLLNLGKSNEGPDFGNYAGANQISSTVKTGRFYVSNWATGQTNDFKIGIQSYPA